MSSTGISKTSAQLFRDCLRLISHISGKTSKKTLNIKRIVKAEFRKNGWEKDTSRVDALKSNAIRGLANYLMLESMQKDKVRVPACEHVYS